VSRPLLCAFVLMIIAASMIASGQQRAHPDFEGVWNSATITPIERPANLKGKAFYTRAEADRLEREAAQRNGEETKEQIANSKGTGTYNAFFREWGTTVVKTLRTSIVTDPPDGRIPPLTPNAEAHRRERLERIKKAENPEDLGLQDQCVGFLTAGPPMLPYSYNSNYQIVQAAGAILIYAEMIHDARIVYMDGRPHAPANLRSALGDSVGRWEGDTLVVDTTNFIDDRGYYGDAGGNFAWDRGLHLVERFRLLDPGTLLYQFEIDDPSVFTRPWKGELTMTRSNERIYEFACHEGNYSLTNMMRGYRATEKP
jgi:hypothetical protein